MPTSSRHGSRDLSRDDVLNRPLHGNTQTTIEGEIERKKGLPEGKPFLLTD